MTIPIAVAASDPDGAVSRVEFFDRSTPIGVVTTPPFLLDWTNVTSGMHSIVARATDDRGGTSFSQTIDIMVGQTPLVVVTAPVGCSSIDGPADVIVAADVISTTRTIARVDFFDGATLVGTSYSAPWSFTLKSATVGSHSITAVAVDDHGSVGRSRPANLTVQPANQPPTVSLMSPTEGARFALGSTLSLTATADDRDGHVASVEFRIGGGTGTLIGRTTTPPYAVAWANMAAGSYTLVAVATDDRNVSATSSPVPSTRRGTCTRSDRRACASRPTASRSGASRKPRSRVASTPEPRSYGVLDEVPQPVRVTVFHGHGCHLCERALAQVRTFREELGFELVEVAIDGDPELEARYRELLPVVEIDGERVFTYYVHEDAFRRRVAAAQSPH
jgi:glutaredoxin